MADIDLHDIRASLKLITDTGGTTLYRNMEHVGCPVCDENFDEVLELTEETHSFEPSTPISFCIVNDVDTVFLFTHV